MTEDTYDHLMNLYNAINCSNRTDSDLRNIITEEAGVYFAGDRTLEKTMELIQNRARLYVNERT